jgi:transposase
LLNSNERILCQQLQHTDELPGPRQRAVAFFKTLAQLGKRRRQTPVEAQVDFGEAAVKLAGELTKVALFVMTLPYSGAMFLQVFPRECTETFLEGHRRAFEYFGGVPRRISYDNSAIAVIEVLSGRERKLTREFLRLESHYLFQLHFCLVRRANEKGHVERLLGCARKSFLVPVPEVATLWALNEALVARCRDDFDASHAW